jgi:hypothetical protein
MKGGMFSLLEAAAKFQGIAEDMRAAPGEIVERACQIVEKEAKESLGHYHRGWPRLKPETIAHKATGDSPLLETGEMRDSIEHTVVEADADHAVGYVGSNSDIAVYQELGTSRGIPPRSFLMGAAMRKEKQIYRMAYSRVAAAFDGRGAAAREWREIMHIVKEVGHQAKKLWDEIKPDEDESQEDR